MSNPSNSLARFRSYSYYHILAMCDSTATADLLAKDSSLDVWNHATQLSRIQELDDLGPFSPKCVAGKGKYIVLINGSTDASFAITNAKWSTATAGSARPGDQNTSIAIDGSLSISEPKGIAFLDQIVKCSIALGVDSSQVIYVLKTFFVGHLDDDESNIPQDQYITDVPPLNLVVYDVSGTFTEAGGVYEMSFVSVGHGAARLPQYSKAINTISLQAGSSLKETFQRLQDTINSSYDDYYKSVIEQVASVNGADTSELLTSLRKVNYVIELGEDYHDPRYTVTDQPAQFKNKAGCDAPAQLTFPVPTSIESAIDSIMRMSTQVKDEMSTGDPSNQCKYEYKIHTALVSTPAGGDSSGSAGSCVDSQMFDYTVYYRVERFLTPKTITYDTAFQAAQTDETPQNAADPAFAQLKRNTIEFQYMYTGENIDILEFDMKINYGLAYLQTATLANTFKNQVERAANKQTQVSTRDVNTQPVRFGGDSIPQTPVFFGTQIKTPVLTGTQNASSSIQSAYTLAKHASIELSEASMKIVGNDQLLRSTNKTSSAEFVTTTSKTVVQPSSDVSPDQQFQDWSVSPAFAKVKIKMPRNNDDIALFTGFSYGKDDAGQDYARDFWFDGYYYIFNVDHEFSDGVFTQTLHLLALPKKSTFDVKETKVEEYQPKQDLPSSYDNKIDCAPPSAGAGRGSINPPFVRPGSDGQPTNKQDADTVSKNTTSLDSVPGWKNKASPEVKNAILQASARYGIDPVVMARVAAQESSFRPTVSAGGGGSAKGLYQFVNATWLERAKSDPSIGVDPNLSTSQQLALRDNPQISANAGASLMVSNSKIIGSKDPGDLYLAHFVGAGAAKPIIAADKAGNGNKTVREIVSSMKGGPRIWAVMKKNNKNLTDSTTSAELRAWSARLMGTTVDNSNSTPIADRKANQAIAAVQNCNAQAAKKDTDPCGNKVDKKA